MTGVALCSERTLADGAPQLRTKAAVEGLFFSPSDSGSLAQVAALFLGGRKLWCC